MSDDNEDLVVLNVTVKSKGKKRSGLEVELRDDGHYYISKVPKGFNSCSVGDRILQINGTEFHKFKSAKHANFLIDTLQMEV